MLRITKETTAENIQLFRLEGRLVGQWVELLRETGAGLGAASFALDLAGVSYANQAGVELLCAWQTQGVRLRNCPLFLHEMLRQTLSPSRQESALVTDGQSDLTAR